MNIILSFIGNLPQYILYCIYQIRIYTNLPIYLIYNDYNSQYLKKIQSMDVILINYEKVNYECEQLNKISNKFKIVSGLKDRKELFFRSFERIYLFRNLLKLYNLDNNIFLEIDNLIYTDPVNWFNIFKTNNIKIAFMFDNINRASTGISYFKDYDSVKLATDYFDNNYLNKPVGKDKKMLNEMSAFSEFYNKYHKICTILPSLNYNDNDFPELYENYKYFNSIFDPSTYGVYLLGGDPYHNGGKIKLYTTNPFGYIKPKNNIKWLIKDGIKKPYIINGNKETLINILHVHSKDLSNGISIPYS